MSKLNNVKNSNSVLDSILCQLWRECNYDMTHSTKKPHIVKNIFIVKK
jgi:hypothetical protein